MVTVSLEGRLGNQMFQAAAAAAHAAYLGEDWAMVCPWPTVAPLCVTFPNLAPRVIHYVHQVQPTHLEATFAYRGIPTEARHLLGYFQSARYWTGRERLIRSLFPLSPGLYLSCGPQPIVAHVRRGDYLQKPDYHPVLPIEYYRNAFRCAGVTRETPIVIHTDDPEWCREHFGTDPSVTIKGPGTASIMDALVDFATAEAVVIANSSLSWWGAYLGRPRQVFAPTPWFGPAGPPDTEDLLPSEWTTIQWSPDPRRA